ncbi:hypothetical protein GWK47_012320 [Chionoecetes opilio]|uniref:Uncharacterized protein n=1 Tax=Chionoecetes opilio TaxID=41210 RepID=A0A8J4XZH6_CHIOP|nr:hypothetical protein GWK47_012320 [Chionoecetes opilio]
MTGEEEDQMLCQPRSLLEAYRRQESWYLVLLGVVIGLVVVVVVLCVLVLRRTKGSHTKLSLTRGIAALSVKTSGNGKTAYRPMAQESSDTLITTIPFHDLTSEEED